MLLKNKDFNNKMSIISIIDIELLEDEENYEDSDESSTEEDNYESVLEIITNLSNSLKVRLDALEDYYKKESDNSIEILSTLSGMYQLSGLKTIEQFFYHICFYSNISSFLKLEAAKSLLEYEKIEDEIYSNDEDDEKESKVFRNDQIRQENKVNKERGFQALNCVCQDFTNIPTPCRIEAICLLMGSYVFQNQANTRLCEFVCDNTLECDFRYKTLLSLENVGSDLMRKELVEIFPDKVFVESLYNLFKQHISKMFPTIKKPNPINSRLWSEILRQLSNDNIQKIYKQKFPTPIGDKLVDRDMFLKNAQFAFIQHISNPTYYRTLSGQFLLQKCELNEMKSFQVETIILSFAQDQELDYDRRADAADLLLRLGSPSMKLCGRDIIIELGRIEGHVRTIFDNAQNVHTEEVEESVVQSLEFLSTLSSKLDTNSIDFDYVNNLIEKILKEKIEKCKTNNIISQEKCSFCDSFLTESKIILCDTAKQDKIFCRKECGCEFFSAEKIRFAMNRIYMDRALYSKYNNTLCNILIKVYTYIHNQEEDLKQEMIKRLIEELEEMSQTCSTGYVTRLINSISGFGEFNIRISFEDQITSNFTGRLNSKIRAICDEDSVFRTTKLNDVVELWLNNKENKNILELNKSEIKNDQPTHQLIIDHFLTTNKQEKVDKCLEDFLGSVLIEMAGSSSNYSNRQNFSLLFRTYMSDIREELYTEFFDYVSDEYFELALRKATMQYES